MIHRNCSLERVLTHQEKKRIEKTLLSAKRIWDPRVKRMFRHYGLEFTQGKNCHFQVYFPGSNGFVTLSSTPSDSYSLKNSTRDLINYIEMKYSKRSDRVY